MQLGVLFLVRFNNFDRTTLELHALTQVTCSYVLLTMSTVLWERYGAIIPASLLGMVEVVTLRRG